MTTPSPELLELTAALDGGLRDALQALGARYAVAHGTAFESHSVLHSDDLAVATLVLTFADGTRIERSAPTRDEALAALKAAVG